MYKLLTTFFLIPFLYNQEQKEYTIKINRKSGYVTISPNNLKIDDSIRLYDEVDLNNDGLKDLILNFYGCGSGGCCMYGIFICKKNGKYICVYQPEYWYDIEVSHKNKNTWKDIIVYQRAGRDENGAEREPLIKELKYNPHHKMYMLNDKQ